MNKKWLRVIEASNSIILNKSFEIKLALTCLLAKGHLLIEDVPGVGKTTLVQVLAKILSIDFQRIQFTSDLLPSDIIGNSIYSPEQKQFEFVKGPLFSNLVLADELNRANSRTQSALLQAMEEGQVSVDRQTLNLPQPFFVVATQNPKNQTGTFAIPESQLDRFLMCFKLDYASPEAEMKLFSAQQPTREKLSSIKPITTLSDLIESQESVHQVFVSPAISKYIFEILNYSRIELQTPLSTRAGISLAMAARAHAFLEGRDFVTPDDIKTTGHYVISHRLGAHEGFKYGETHSRTLFQAVAVPI